MKKYIGTNVIIAEPKEKDGKAGYKVQYEDGHISWIPKYVFERAYRVFDGCMNFGNAIEMLGMGFKVARKGWNNGMFVVYQKGYPHGIPCNKQTAEAWGMDEGDLFRCNPYLQIREENGTHSMYSPSNLDLVSVDWYVVETK